MTTDDRKGKRDPNNPKHANQLRHIGQGRQTDDYKPEYCELLISIMAQGDSLAAFCAEVKTGRRVAYAWMKKYPEFAKAYEDGYEQCLQWWERLVKSSALDVIPQSLKDKGSKKINDDMVRFKMKTSFREQYSEKQIVDMQSSDGSMSPVNIIIEEVAVKKNERSKD
jgi:hypothetical protein